MKPTTRRWFCSISSRVGKRSLAHTTQAAIVSSQKISSPIWMFRKQRPVFIVVVDPKHVCPVNEEHSHERENPSRKSGKAAQAASRHENSGVAQRLGRGQRAHPRGTRLSGHRHK